MGNGSEPRWYRDAAVAIVAVALGAVAMRLGLDVEAVCRAAMGQ